MLRLPAYPSEDPALVVVSFDPGGTTGWAVHKASRLALEVGGWTFTRQGGHFCWNFGQFHDRDEDVMVDQMIALVREAWQHTDFEAGDQLAVVTESFRLRMFSADDNLLSPVRISAAYKYAMRGSGVPLYWQTPADAMRAVTDERLKAWGVYVGNSAMGHARDAQRHGILFMRKYASEEKIRRSVARADINTPE